MRAVASQLRVQTTKWPSRVLDDRWPTRTHADGARLVNAWGEWLGRIPWEWFITLTLDPKRRFPPSSELVDREVFWFLGHVAHVYRRDIGWVYAIERPPSGHWHAHAIIIGLPEPRWSRLTGSWQERNGGINCERADGSKKLALYTVKSSADCGEVVIGDTLRKYQKQLSPEIVVDLLPNALGV